MSNEIAEFNLPHAPRGVCFDRQDFIKSNFSLESFIEEHQNGVSLETMRDDLGSYLKVLRLAMIELINKDYANFVNLSATLIGFDKSIEKICSPLAQLKREVEDVKQHLEDAMKELSMWLNQRHSLQKKKQLLRHYSYSIKCLTTLDKLMSNISDKNNGEKIVLIDRATIQYVQLKYTICKCEPLLKSEQMSQYSIIGEILIQTINELLFQCWNDSDEEKLLATLTSLATLDRVAETEALIRKQAVGPLLQDIISEASLQKHKHLKVVFDTIINLLETKLKVLLKVTQHSKLSFLSRKYNFLVNCFWCEIESRLEVNLTSIFAPGNPIIFYQRYNESMEFVTRLESYCSDSDVVKPIHQTIEYKSFCKRWNLPVYFQIRFQEIAGGFEGTLGTVPTYQNSDAEFLIHETRNCWTALQQCWSEDIYIEALGHKFWKLTLQLLQRYSSWCCQICKQHDLTKSENTTLNKTLINHSINLYLDSQSLLQKLPQLLQSIQHKMPPKAKDVLAKSLTPAKESLDNVRIKVKECIINDLHTTYNVYLKQVSDIPRLYRKTNRSLPYKPCVYIESISKSIQEFNEESCKKLDGNFNVELYEGLFNTLTFAYFKYVEDVLTSVQRTEESLRRLKQIRDKTLQATSEPVGITDDDKIRLQLNIDVTAFGKIATSLNVDIKHVHKLIELNNMVKDAVKNIDIK